MIVIKTPGRVPTHFLFLAVMSTSYIFIFPGGVGVPGFGPNGM
jgi:hypothetical protein